MNYAYGELLMGWFHTLLKVSEVVMMHYIKDDKRAHRRSLPNSGRVGPPSSLYTPPPPGSTLDFIEWAFNLYAIHHIFGTYTNGILGLRFQIMKFQSRVNSLMSPYTTLVPPMISENGLWTNDYALIHILYVSVICTPSIQEGTNWLISIKEWTSGGLTQLIQRQPKGQINSSIGTGGVLWDL